jgi:hypothetical protein
MGEKQRSGCNQQAGREGERQALSSEAPASGYQLWKSPQLGQATDALTSASKATPQ